jgi:hypothetical protein
MGQFSLLGTSLLYRLVGFGAVGIFSAFSIYGRLPWFPEISGVMTAQKLPSPWLKVEIFY